MCVNDRENKILILKATYPVSVEMMLILDYSPLHNVHPVLKVSVNGDVASPTVMHKTVPIHVAFLLTVNTIYP